ncbi:hypothetical protein LINPERHAP2_LOCUS29681 [Linum perenne]
MISTNYTTTTTSCLLLPLLVLVLVLVTSTSFPAASGQYCGSKEATDPDFNVYAAMALNEVLDDLATRNKTEAKLSYPSGGGAGSAYAEASCSVTISNEECHKCLYNGLLPYVRKCTSFTTGAAHYDTCSLYFQINE